MYNKRKVIIVGMAIENSNSTGSADFAVEIYRSYSFVQGNHVNRGEYYIIKELN